MIRVVSILFSLAFSASLYAADAEEIYIRTTIGAGVGIALVLIFAFYKLGKYLMAKLLPNSPVWLHKVAGVMAVVVFFGIWGGMAG